MRGGVREQSWKGCLRASFCRCEPNFRGLGVYVPRSVDWHPASRCIISLITRNNDGNQVAPLTREHPRRRYTPVSGSMCTPRNTRTSERPRLTRDPSYGIATEEGSRVETQVFLFATRLEYEFYPPCCCCSYKACMALFLGRLEAPLCGHARGLARALVGEIGEE